MIGRKEDESNAIVWLRILLPAKLLVLVRWSDHWRRLCVRVCGFDKIHNPQYVVSGSFDFLEGGGSRLIYHHSCDPLLSSFVPPLAPAGFSWELEV